MTIIFGQVVSVRSSAVSDFDEYKGISCTGTRSHDWFPTGTRDLVVMFTPDWTLIGVHVRIRVAVTAIILSYRFILFVFQANTKTTKPLSSPLI